MSPLRLLLIVIAIVLIWIVGCLLLAPHPTLPIYRLQASPVTRPFVESFAREFGTGPITVSETADRFIARRGPYRTEVYKKSGGVWVEDSTALWAPEIHPTLPDTLALSRAPSTIMGLMDSLASPTQSLRSDSSVVQFAFTGFGRSGVIRGTSGVRTSEILDVQTNFGGWVSDSSSTRGRSTLLPTVGGGASFKVVHGDQGRVIGFSGVWRKIVGIDRRAQVVPRSVADQQFLQRMNSSEVDSLVSYDAILAYYAAPAPYEQTLLVPVWVYRGTVVLDGHQEPMMPIYVDATSIPRWSVLPSNATPRRTDADHPPVWASGDSDTEPGKEIAAYTHNTSGGEDDVAAFLSHFPDTDGWKKNAEWKGADAWQTDWMANRSVWVNATDLIYFYGHANPDSWQLAEPGSATRHKWVRSSETHTTPGTLGNDVEVVAIHGCGPLHDKDIKRGGGDAFDRWSDLFGGLHLLLGYACSIPDEAGAGDVFATELLGDRTFINAWFKSAVLTKEQVEHRGSDDDVTAAAMWVFEPGRSPDGDRLGQTVEDSRTDHVTELRLMWTQP